MSTKPAARFTFLLDPELKVRFEELCAAQDITPSQLMRQMINGRYPDHGILGEEHGREGIDRDLVWVLDPIDGTRAFIAGVPMFGSLIALVEKGKPRVGVIEMPALGERFVGHIGHPSLADGKPCRTRDCGGLGNARVERPRAIGEADPR